jgi:manganese oxidase
LNVNLIVSDKAFDQDGQLFFDIFDTYGFLGDVMTVN